MVVTSRRSFLFCTSPSFAFLPSSDSKRIFLIAYVRRSRRFRTLTTSPPPPRPNKPSSIKAQIDMTVSFCSSRVAFVKLWIHGPSFSTIAKEEHQQNIPLLKTRWLQRNMVRRVGICHEFGSAYLWSIFSFGSPQHRGGTRMARFSCRLASLTALFLKRRR